MNRMPPQEIEAKVKGIIAKILKKPEDSVTMESRYREDLGADSLAVVELLYEFEQTFDLAIPDDKARSIRTVGDSVKLLAEVLGT
jgi:acyl carrier protein